MADDAWAAWDAARKAGELPTEVARGLDEADLARLLSEAGAGRDDERKLLAAEMLRRSTDLEQRRNERVLPPDPRGDAQRDVANRSAERIHAAERDLERQSASQVAKPRLKAAHEASLLAEEHRTHVETHIERRAEHREAVRDLKETLERRRQYDRDHPR